MLWLEFGWYLSMTEQELENDFYATDFPVTADTARAALVPVGVRR